MDETLSYREAWRDFHAYITQPEKWEKLTPAERNRVSLAESDYHGRRLEKKTQKPFGLGDGRIEKILSELTPGRYEFSRVVILHEK